MSILSKLVLPLLLIATTDSAIATPFTPFEATYQITKQNEIIANTHLSLKKNSDSSWRYQSKSTPTSWLAKALGVTVTETSTWRWHNNQIQILDYHYIRSGKEKEVHLSFNWKTMTVVNTINGDHWRMDIPDGTLDKLSINLGLMAQLSKQIKDTSFPVADGGKLKYYDFKIDGEAHINTALGNIKTIKVKRNKRGRKDKQAALWLAPEINYLLVRMEKEDKDREKVVLEIKSLNNP